MKRRVGMIVTVIALGVAVAMVASARPAAQVAAIGAPAGGPTIEGAWIQAEGENQNVFALEFGLSEESAKIQNMRPVNRSVVIDPLDGRIPFQPWAQKVRDARYEAHADHQRLTSKNLDGRAKCYLAGVPRIIIGGGFITITRFLDRANMQFEFTHQYRVIYTDGRPHLHKSVKLWNGDSRGRWEGNTLVVETTNLNGYAWLDLIGSFISNEGTVVERVTPIEANTMSWTATITDPRVFTRPWTIRFRYVRDPDSPAAFAGTTVVAGGNREMWEQACIEGNQFPLWTEIQAREFSRKAK